MLLFFSVISIRFCAVIKYYIILKKSWNCSVTTYIVLILIYDKKKIPFSQIGDWRVLADDNWISCFCCWWWTSESASKSHGARKTGGIFRTLLTLRPRSYGENLSRPDPSGVSVSLAYPSYPMQANLSYISLQNLAKKQNVGSAGHPHSQHIVSSCEHFGSLSRIN